MRSFSHMLPVFLLTATLASAQHDSIQEVISLQVEALKSDDFDKAFQYASPTIQSIFQDSETFGEMIRGGYPMILRPSEIEFLDEINKTNLIWQHVRFQDENRKSYWFVYVMIIVGNEWRIDGVYPVDSPDPMA